MVDHIDKVMEGQRNGWSPIENAPMNVRVRVKHDRGTYGSGNATGIRTEAGKWICSEAFIDPTTMRMYSTPTHWMAIAPSNSGDL